eukprot:1155915-Pelagomonas_calceolata.AAC.5
MSLKLGCPDKKVCFASMPSFRADGRLAVSVPKPPAKLVANVSTTPATTSHGPLKLQGYLKFLFGRLDKVSGPGVRWAGQGSLV